MCSLAAFGAQSSIRASQDARQQRKQALEIIPLQRRDIEDRARQHVTGGNRLHALRWRSRRSHFHHRRDERQLDVEQHLRNAAGTNVKRRRARRSESRTRRSEHVAARRHVRKGHLTRTVCDGPGEGDVAIEGQQLDINAGDSHGAFKAGHRGNHTSGTSYLLGK